MKALLIPICLWLIPASAFAADCSSYPNAIYEQYWGYNRSLAGQMFCASKGMSEGQCLSLGGDFKKDRGSGSDVCFLNPRTEPKITLPPVNEETPAATNGVLTFKFKNQYRYTVHVKLYSDTRPGWAWPTTSSHWTLNDRIEHEYRITCNVGEKICIGGWSNNDNPDNGVYWGVGYQDKHNCTKCCMECGTLDQNRSKSINLN